jgi:hypothetical protein
MGLALAGAFACAAHCQHSIFFLMLPCDCHDVLHMQSIQSQLDKLHVPYSYGYSIIILTAMVKLVTLPLTKKQVRAL